MEPTGAGFAQRGLLGGARRCPPGPRALTGDIRAAGGGTTLECAKGLFSASWLTDSPRFI